jgi:hypothetical protein
VKELIRIWKNKSINQIEVKSNQGHEFEQFTRWKGGTLEIWSKQGVRGIWNWIDHNKDLNHTHKKFKVSSC